MNRKIQMIIIVLVNLFCIVITNTYSEETENVINTTKVINTVNEEYQKIVNVKEYKQLLLIPENLEEKYSTQLESSWLILRGIYMTLWKNIESTKKLPLKNAKNVIIVNQDKKSNVRFKNQNTKVFRHNIFVEGGRAMWILEKLLNENFLVINKENSEEKINKERIKIYNKILKKISNVNKENKKRVVAHLIDTLPTMSINEKIKLASSKTTPDVILGILAENSNTSIRKAVAMNLNTPTESLIKLMKNDSDLEIRAAARKTRFSVRPFIE